MHCDIVGNKISMTLYAHSMVSSQIYQPKNNLSLTALNSKQPHNTFLEQMIYSVLSVNRLTSWHLQLFILLLLNFPFTNMEHNLQNTFKINFSYLFYDQ
jgi:hypothetical protein